MAETVLVKLQIPVDLHAKVKAGAALERLKIGDYIVKVLKEHVDRE